MAKVPSVSTAQVESISDPTIRAVLRMVTNHIAVRSGDIGNGDQAYLTMADLTGDRANALKLASALAAPLKQGMNTPGQPLADLADALRDRILRSAAWQEMFARLQAIEAPDTVVGSPAWLLLQEARTRGAAIDHVQQAVQSTNESLVEVRDSLTTAIDGNVAAIAEETKLRTTADTAIVESVKDLIASVDESFAGVDEKMALRVNSDNALAQAINTIWARVGSNQGLVQTGTEIVANPVGSVATKWDQLQATVTQQGQDIGSASTSIAAIRQDLSVTNTSVDGLKGKWGVKMDLNGYVAGVALNAGVDPQGRSESSFIILADVFAIGAPGKPNVVPFAIDAKTGLIAIDGNLVATGTISGTSLAAYAVGRNQLALKAVGGAQIDDLAVDTLQIAGNAVTVPKVVARTDIMHNNMTTPTDIISTTITLKQPGTVMAIVTVSQYSSNFDADHDWKMWLSINGSDVASAEGHNQLDAVAMSGALTLPAGTYTIAVRRISQYDNWIGNRNMTIFGVMR
jgi:hypothetical protein